MTLVIAAKGIEGIAIAYDRRHNKVKSLGSNLGFACKAGTSRLLNDPIRDFQEIALKSQGNLYDGIQSYMFLERQKHFMKMDQDNLPFTSSNWPSGYNQLTYLIGLNHNPGLQLLMNNSLEDFRLREVTQGGIGSGYYPEVKHYLETHHNPGMPLVETINVVREAFCVGKAFDSSRHNVLSGEGFATFTEKNGLKIIDSTISSGE